MRRGSRRGTRGPRAALVAALLATLAFPLSGETAPPPAVRPERALPDHTAWHLGNGTFFDPVTGRTITLPLGKAGGNDANAADSGNHGSGDLDVRLHGHRRTSFYLPDQPMTGPGRLDLVDGGLCDGLAGPDVSVEPGQVAVDTSGRVFWIDHGARAHLKGAPYVRTLNADGTVRTLGALPGPIEGRHIRDFGGAEVMMRIVPDDKGGVFFSHSALNLVVNPAYMQYAGDDQPSSTVIGHLDATGKATYVAGTAPSETATDGPLAEATFQSITAMATDHAGHLFVADGPVPWSMFGIYGTSPNQRTFDPTTPGPSENTTGGTMLRVVNLTNDPVTYADGQGDPVVAEAGTVTRIGGVRENGAAVGSDAAAVPVAGVRLGFVPSLSVGADGVIRMLHRDGDLAQVLAVNPTSRPAIVHGQAVPSGRVVSVAGSTGGYAEGPGRAAKFDFRITQTWFYGAIATAADGTAYVSDTVNNRLRRVDRRGVVTTVVDKPLRFPMGVAVEPGGGVLVADWYNARIRRVAGGRVSNVVGTGIPGACQGARNDGTFTGGAAALTPHDTATDSRGNVYVADLALGVVRRITPDGMSRIVAGTPHDCHSGSPYMQGIPTCPFVDPKGDGGAPEKAVLQAPAYLAVDQYDNLYVSDGTSVRYVNFSDRALTPQDVRVEPHTIGTVYSVKGVIERVLPPTIDVFGQKFTIGIPYSQLVGLTGIAVDKANTLYVADLNARRIVSITYCGLLTPIAGTGAPPGVKGDGDGGPALAAPISPVGLALDEQRQLLFVASTAEQRVRVVNVGVSPVEVSGTTLLPGTITTFAGGGRCVGTSITAAFMICSYGDGNAATKAALLAPFDVAADPGGRVYIGDAGANLVKLVEPDGDIETLAGITPDAVGFLGVIFGQGGYCGDGGVAYRGCFGGISGLDLRPDGDLLVTEMMTGIVRRIAAVANAPVRPPGLVEPPRGAGWTFGTPVLLVAPDDVDVRDPDIAIAPGGTGYVLARQASQSQGAAGCALWRYTISRTARADLAIVLPEPDGTGPLPGTSSGIGRSCALGVTREPSGSVVPPLGDAIRLGFASTAVVPDEALLSGAVMESAITGASRSGGEEFLRSPAGVVGASVAVRTPRIGVDAESTTFYLAYCCTGRGADAGAAGIAVAKSLGGIQYQQAGFIPFDSQRQQTPPSNERQFFGTPVVRGDHVLIPYYTRGCLTTTCTSATERYLEGYVAESTDGGTTWTSSKPLFGYECGLPYVPERAAYCTGHHGVPQLAMDKAGRRAFVWDDGVHTYVRTSTEGTTWTPAAQVDRDVAAASYPVVVAGDAGRIAVAFLGSARPVPSAAASDAEWYAFLAVSRDGGRTFAQSLATETPVFVGALCQYQAPCISGGQWESAAGNFFDATVSPLDGRVVLALPAGAGKHGAVSGTRIVVVRQCSGPAMTGNAAAAPCAPARPPAPHRPVPKSAARNEPLAVASCVPPDAPPPSAAPAPRPPSPSPVPPDRQRQPDRAPPAAAVLPGAVAGAVPPPLVQPGNAPQPQAQPEANAQHVANPAAGIAAMKQERTEMAEEYAMVRDDPELPPVVPWAVALSVFAAAGLVTHRSRSTEVVR